MSDTRYVMLTKELRQVLTELQRQCVDGVDSIVIGVASDGCGVIFINSAPIFHLHFDGDAIEIAPAPGITVTPITAKS